MFNVDTTGGQQKFSVQNWIINILDIVFHTLSVTATHLLDHCNAKGPQAINK